LWFTTFLELHYICLSAMEPRPHVESFIALPRLSKWFGVSCCVGVLAGISSAALLMSLTWATELREAHGWVPIAFLPVGGFITGWLYQHYGQSIEAGNNLLLEEIHEASNTIPLGMAPMVLFGTVLTHLLGGSAGREGTALQMAASLADQLNHIVKFKPDDRRILLMAGLSGGFASVFGTPLAGTVFGLEVLAIGTIRHTALFPLLLGFTPYYLSSC
jgi:H+/Cl- antiporter ClcA